MLHCSLVLMLISLAQRGPPCDASNYVWLSWLWQGGHLFVCARSVQPPGSSYFWLRHLATGVHVCMSCVTALLTAVGPLRGRSGAANAGQCALPADTSRWRLQRQRPAHCTKQLLTCTDGVGGHCGLSLAPHECLCSQCQDLVLMCCAGGVDGQRGPTLPAVHFRVHRPAQGCSAHNR